MGSFDKLITFRKFVFPLINISYEAIQAINLAAVFQLATKLAIQADKRQLPRQVRRHLNPFLGTETKYKKRKGFVEKVDYLMHMEDNVTF